jgi:hypothetical protein
MQRVDTARQVVVAVTADLRRAHLRVAAVTADRPADMADLPADLLVAAATADLRKDRLRVDTAAAVSDNRPVVMAEDSAAAVADLVRPAEDSRLLVDRWVRAWATTSTRRCR